VDGEVFEAIEGAGAGARVGRCIVVLVVFTHEAPSRMIQMKVMKTTGQ